MRAIAVLTSGGDSPGMNAALRSVAKVCLARGIEATGVLDGYDGLIDRRFLPLGRGGGVDLDQLNGLGGTVLGTARCARFFTPEGRQAAAASMKAFDGLLVIGGNGSLTGAHLLAREHGVKVVGLPASIDNDIGCSSTAIGVDTALNTIVEACDRVSDTARSHRRAFVVEVMGRQSGYLAMASAIAAGADAVLFREQGRSEAELVDAVAGVIRKAFTQQQKRRVLIIKTAPSCGRWCSGTWSGAARRRSRTGWSPGASGWARWRPCSPAGRTRWSGGAPRRGESPPETRWCTGIRSRGCSSRRGRCSMAAAPSPGSGWR
jgi:6-phosphofructokinase 1